MKNISKWILMFVLFLVVLFALSYGLTAYGHGRMMSRGMGFMNFGMWFGWLGWGSLLLIVFYGVSRLVAAPRGETPLQTCHECGQEVETEWKNCPYCGAGMSV